jgi:hypothetical protein
MQPPSKFPSLSSQKWETASQKSLRIVKATLSLKLMLADIIILDFKLQHRVIVNNINKQKNKGMNKTPKSQHVTGRKIEM